MKCKLGNIIKINQYTYTSHDQWKYVNYLDTGNITKNVIDTVQYINLSKEVLPSRARRKVKKNSILYSMVRPNQSHYGIVKDNIDNFLVSTGFAVIDVDTNKICPAFIYYMLTQQKMTEHLQTIAEQSVSAYPSIKPSDIENLDIILTSLLQQQKITKLLGSLDDKIELNRQINANLEQQAQAIFKSWFIDFEPFGGTMPDDWIIGTLEDIAAFSNGYAFKSKDLLYAPEQNCYKVFKQGHIKPGGGMILEGTKSWFPKQQSANLQKYILRKGDILMAMTDMKDRVAILGNTAVMGLDGQYILNQRVGLLRCKKKYEISYPYIFLLTNSPAFLKDLRIRANSGVQVNLSSNEIKNASILIAPDEINSKFNRIIEPMFEIIFKNDIEIDCLSTLRDTLLPKLMSGEIDVSKIEID